MMRFLCVVAALTLAGCGSGSSSSNEPAVDDRVLSQHACLEGTWLAVSRNLKINNTNYPVATERVFLVVSGQTNVNNLMNAGEGMVNYAGSGIRTWVTENQFTEDIHSGSWLATIQRNAQTSEGTLAIQDACRNVYGDGVKEDRLPQCQSSALFDRHTQITLDCSGDVGLMTMENARASINYQRLNSNVDIIAFNEPNDTNPVRDDAEPPLPVDLYEEEEIEDIIEALYGPISGTDQPTGDTGTPSDNEPLPEEIQDILDGFDDPTANPLAPDEPSSPDGDPVQDSDNGSGSDSADGDTPATGEPSTADPKDSDGDGVNDARDAFPQDPSEQYDFDRDGIGDNADLDDDNDLTPDTEDDFPRNPAEQTDTDHDGVGNHADNDDDADGFPDPVDAFPLDPTETQDSDGDGIGNNRDPDDDNDGHMDTEDAFPNDPMEWFDTDRDGKGNNQDGDDDNDTVPDVLDAFPLDPNEWLDTDSDGMGNNQDPDDDNDGHNDGQDAFPENPEEWLDTDVDGIGNNQDTDDDNDTVPDLIDAFPLNANEWLDTDNDGVGNNQDTDDDNDGHLDSQDAFPEDHTEWMDTDRDGVGNNQDSDDDNDGLSDTQEASLGTQPLNPDTDDDSVMDGLDAFPLNPNESKDSDLDGYGDNQDKFPNDPSEHADFDGDGIGDNADWDDDNDLVADALDPEPFNPEVPGQLGGYLAQQDWQSFYDGRDWYVTEFGLNLDSAPEDFVSEEGDIQFAIQWTQQTKDRMAVLLGIEPSMMTDELANAFCSPVIEVGKASTYGVGDEWDMIAELDSDLSQCIYAEDEPASIKLTSYIPTQVGYQYRVVINYRMRQYQDMPYNAYRHLVATFGDVAEHFEPAFDLFRGGELIIVATDTATRLSLEDNGLPDSYGILVNEITVENLGPVAHYQSCLNRYGEGSDLFRQCIEGEMDSDNECQITKSTLSHHHSDFVELERRIEENLFDQGSVDDHTGAFFSIGHHGAITLSCQDSSHSESGQAIYGQTLTFKEVNLDHENWHSLARVSVELSDCDNDKLNGKNDLGIAYSGHSFTYPFIQSSDGSDYSGCRLQSITIRDKTPNSSPDLDGFDINGLRIHP